MTARFGTALRQPRRAARLAAAVLDMQELAGRIADVREGRLTIPPRGGAHLLRLMEQIRPWCVSRQLRRGYQLPVWDRCCGETVVQDEAPDHCPSCGRRARRATPTRSTWFSSARWPSATLRLARGHTARPRLLPGPRALTARETTTFGRAHDDDRLARHR